MELVKSHVEHDDLPEVSIDGEWAPLGIRPPMRAVLEDLPRPVVQTHTPVARLRPAADVLADWLVTYGQGLDPVRMAPAMAQRYLKTEKPKPIAARGDGPFASLLRSARAEVV